MVDKGGYTPEEIHINEYMPNSPIAAKESKQAFKKALKESNLTKVQGKDFHLLEHDELLGEYNVYFIVDPEEPPPPPPPGCEQPCERDCEVLDETLIDFKINGWGVFEHIRNQAFETKYVFHGDVLAATRSTFGSIGPFTAKFVSPTQSKSSLLNCSGSSPCTGRFVNANFRIFRDWDLSEFGEPYKIDWAEVDNGTTTFGFSFPLSAGFKVDTVNYSGGTTVSFSRTGAQIITLGNAPVFYCDPLFFQNSTGSITFRCN